MIMKEKPMNPTEPSEEEVKQLANKIMVSFPCDYGLSSYKQFMICQHAAKWHLAEVAEMKGKINKLKTRCAIFKGNLTIASLQHAEWEIEQATQGTK